MKEKNGFTLVEMIIYIAVIGMVMTTFAYYVLSFSKSDQKNISQGEVQSNMRDVLKILSLKIRGAESVNTSTSFFNIDKGVLSLKMSDVNIDPTIIRISQENGSLLLVEAGNTSTITSDKVIVNKMIFRDMSSGTARGNLMVELDISDKSSGVDSFSYSKNITAVFDLRI